MTLGLLLLAVFTFSYALLSDTLQKTPFTAPMLFIGFGVALSSANLTNTDQATEMLHFVAETTLVILLFLDAARTDLRGLLGRFVWPARMLVLGVPLSIAIGALTIMPLLPDWPVFAAFLLAAILAPTDAALGQAVVSNEAVPIRERRALTVESGLNDGMALPAILLFASLVASESGNQDTNWVAFAGRQLILGPLVGIMVGTLAGKLLIAAREHATTSPTSGSLGTVATAIICYLSADLLGGNGFIATFVGGLLFGSFVKNHSSFIYEFTESEGKGLSWLAFFAIGFVLVPDAMRALDGTTIAIILASLFIVRPLAVWLSLIGTDADWKARLFFGWFGPRGLATALFALLVVEQIDHAFAEPILHIAVNAVWMSAVLHGVSALPGAKWYAKGRGSP